MFFWCSFYIEEYHCFFFLIYIYSLRYFSIKKKYIDPWVNSWCVLAHKNQHFRLQTWITLQKHLLLAKFHTMAQYMGLVESWASDLDRIASIYMFDLWSNSINNIHFKIWLIWFLSCLSMAAPNIKIHLSCSCHQNHQKRVHVRKSNRLAGYCI